MTTAILFVLFCSLFLALSYLESRRAQTLDDFCLAGRSASGWSAGLSIAASSIGASATIGVCGLAFEAGFPAFWWLGAGAIGLVLSAILLVDRIRAQRPVSLLGAIEESAGRPAAKLAAIVILAAWTGILAAQFSAMGASQTGEAGDYGWMTKNTMFPGMESVFTARLNNLYIIDTQYGKHIVKVTDRSEPMLKKKVAILEKEALPSGNTINEYYVQANELATKADGKYENLKKVADEEGLALLTRNNLREGEERVGSVNDRTKEISKWAYEAKEGKVSNVLNINNDYYVVAALKKIHKKGYTPVNEVAASISNILYTQKLGEKKAAEVAEKIAGLDSMQAIADTLGTAVSTRDGISFSSYMNQGLDPKFIGAVSVAEEGVISAPLAGNIGVYVYKVTSRDSGTSFTEDDAKNQAAQMSYYASQSLLPVMMQDADVEDNRARFF